MFWVLWDKCFEHTENLFIFDVAEKLKKTNFKYIT